MMHKTVAILALALCACALPARAIEPLTSASMDEQHTFKIAILQVTDIEPYQQALNGFMKTLAASGIAADKNLSVNRVKIDFDIEKGGFWSRVGVLLRIREEAKRIALSHPDLVLTIGTPATKYARGIMQDAHIPLVFTAVASPEEVGCTSIIDGGPGVTGSTLYTDMADSLTVVRQLFPAAHKIGMVHTDDENGVAHVAAAKASAPALGLSVTSQLVDKNDSIVPSLRALYADGAGVDMFAVPLDTYYGLHRYEAALDLGDFGAANKVPVVTLAMVPVPGASLYVGADFELVGSLAGTQAAKILKRRTRTEMLPILRQETPTVLVDPARLAALNVVLPADMASHKTPVKNGLWQIDTAVK